MDIIRVWTGGDFKLTMWDTGRTDWRGQTNIGFTLEDCGRVIFEDEDFCGSPMHADDSDETVGALLGFLSIRPGDTDMGYFSGYTRAQFQWCDERAEELSWHSMELEGE